MAARFLLIGILVLVNSIFYGLDAFPEEKTLFIEGDSFKIYQTQNLKEVVWNRKKVFTLKETTEYLDTGSYDLYLDFEKPITALKNYKVIRSQYLQNAYQKVNGQFSGKFSRSDQYLSIFPLATSIFTAGSPCGSFTIEFQAYFYKNFDKQYIFQYSGNNLSDEEDKNTYGISIYTRGGKIVYEFNNIFWEGKNESYSFTITEDEPFSTTGFEHHAVTFNIMNGKLTTYKNGVEQQTIWITRGGTVLSPIFNPHIMDQLSTTILIGKDAFFSLDNFIVKKDSETGFDIKQYNRSPAFLITGIYKLSDNMATLTRLSYGASGPTFNHVQASYRISEDYFDPSDEYIPWVNVENGISDFPVDFEKGRYMQFKLYAYPYEEEEGEVVLSNITVQYKLDALPLAPVVASVKPQDGSALITWVPSPESDVIGYEIYYGNSSGDYICSESSCGKSPVFIASTGKDSITNLSHTLSGLQNEKPYFIAMRTIDRYNQRSGFSKEFYVRPSVVYKKGGYSIER